MERVLLIEDGFLSIRSFKLPLDIELPEGSKVTLVKPNNPYELLKQGEPTEDEIVGCCKIRESRAMGHYKEALVDVYFSNKKASRELTALLQEESRTKLITDHFRICETSGQFLTLIQ